jgi:hypothetical protein
MREALQKGKVAFGSTAVFKRRAHHVGYHPNAAQKRTSPDAIGPQAVMRTNAYLTFP